MFPIPQWPGTWMGWTMVGVDDSRTMVRRGEGQRVLEASCKRGDVGSGTAGDCGGDNTNGTGRDSLHVEKSAVPGKDGRMAGWRRDGPAWFNGSNGQTRPGGTRTEPRPDVKRPGQGAREHLCSRACDRQTVVVVVLCSAMAAEGRGAADV
ncbi:hypothetical protein BC567DRAFT_251249 [Phyllosticta citribraziliensis]